MLNHPYANLTKSMCFQQSVVIHPRQGIETPLLCLTTKVFYLLRELTKTAFPATRRPATPVLPLSKICRRILTMAKPRSHERHHLGLCNFVQFRHLREWWLVQKWTIPAYLQNPRQIKNYEKLRDFTNRGKVIRMRRSDTCWGRPPFISARQRTLTNADERIIHIRHFPTPTCSIRGYEAHFRPSSNETRFYRRHETHFQTHPLK